MLISCSAMIISVIIAAERSFWRNSRPYITASAPSGQARRAKITQPRVYPGLARKTCLALKGLQGRECHSYDRKTNLAVPYGPFSG
jgi:hypothetical protein